MSSGPTTGHTYMINYIQDFFPEAYAGDFSSQLSQPGAALLGTSGIWFRDSGSAY